MRLKVDENLPTELAELLRSAGHEADTVADEQASGAPDPALAELCKREGRALVTLDRGFADIRAYPPEEYAGIVVLRPEKQDKLTGGGDSAWRVGGLVRRVSPQARPRGAAAPRSCPPPAA